MKEYEQIKREYDSLVVKKATCLMKNKYIDREIRGAEEELQNYIEARDILNNSIRMIHQKFKVEIEKIITGAIRQIFNRDLTLELVYKEMRDGISSYIIIKENGEELEPKDDLGGSILDIISMSFRIVMWQMSSYKARNVFILDEPFKWTGKLSQVTGLILKELSKKFNFQVILITHDDNLIAIADKIFKVDHINGKSRIKTIRRNRRFKDGD